MAGVASGIAQIAGGKIFPGIVLIGGGMVMAGLSMLLFYLCRLATKGGAKLTESFLLKLKNRFIGRRKSND